MSISLLHKVFAIRDPELSEPAHHALKVIAFHCNQGRNDRRCALGDRRLAAEMSAHRITATRAGDLLQSLGYLTMVRRPYVTTQYQIADPACWPKTGIPSRPVCDPATGTPSRPVSAPQNGRQLVHPAGKTGTPQHKTGLPERHEQENKESEQEGRDQQTRHANAVSMHDILKPFIKGQKPKPETGTGNRDADGNLDQAEFDRRKAEQLANLDAHQDGTETPPSGNGATPDASADPPINPLWTTPVIGPGVHINDFVPEEIETYDWLLAEQAKARAERSEFAKAQQRAARAAARRARAKAKAKPPPPPPPPPRKD